MKFLITGGAGFIGSHIAERLLGDGHFVRVLDNFTTGKLENLNFALSQRSTVDSPQSVDHGPWTENFQLLNGDIRDFSTCLRACDGIDYVFHEAALISVPESLEKPYEYNEVNIDGTVNMLNAAKEKKVKRFVFASSCAVYGEAESFPQKESDPFKLISPYALTKLTGEYYCRIFSKNYGLQTVCLRYFNVFGPKQSPDSQYAGVIVKFIDNLLQDKDIEVHGDGKQSRDFVYIDNVVQANILAATSILNTQYSILNTGTGSEYNILDIVRILAKIMNKNISPTHTSSRPGDVRRTLADISKIKKLLNYSPKIDFEEGLSLAVDWFEKQPIKVR